MMLRRFCWFLPVLLVCAWSLTSSAQPAAPVSAQIHLGDSVASLNGPWKFHVGDSPIDPATHQPSWAEPGFDDSAWDTVDLTPKTGSLDPISGLTDYAPGWTARGHAGYWGYAWYRIRVRIEARPGVKLALAGASDVDDIYQAFDNGVLIGGFGNFSGAHPVIYYTQPAMFPLPDPVNDSAGGSTQVIAFRIWMEPNTLFQGDDVGGFHNAPLIGQASSVSARYQMRWIELVRAYLLSPFQALVFALLGIIACSLTFFDRSDRVYLWIGLNLLTSAVYFTISGVGS